MASGPTILEEWLATLPLRVVSECAVSDGCVRPDCPLARWIDFLPLTRFGWNYWQQTLFVLGTVSIEFDLREPVNAYFVEVEYQHLAPGPAHRCVFHWFHLGERSTPGNASSGLSARYRHLHL